MGSAAVCFSLIILYISTLEALLNMAIKNWIFFFFHAMKGVIVSWLDMLLNKLNCHLIINIKYVHWK